MTNCQVCNRDRETTVAASPIGPVTLAYCDECLEHGAVRKEPLTAIASSVDDLRPSIVKHYTVFKNGEYQPLEAAFD